ncbi:MAG: hydroxymethylbilane synthase [Haliscomenobacter sp.]|nr:hydroxymethylbilane synthase [Haliscomenobacter sp.]MBK8877105.1 hydroxymethylbilane synthase [Haliscomenobacter sp.]
MKRIIRMGTRGSKLALWQAEYTSQALRAIGVESELVIIKTQGDPVQDLSFDKMEGEGFFTKEIEDALLRGDIDLAVHSMKDLPTRQPDGLCISAVSYREDPSDVLLVREDAANPKKLLQLPEGAVTGTSSSRRKAQILDFRPDLQIRDLRGNVLTRLDKLRQGDYDAILLARAGINRLNANLSGLTVIPLNPREFVPAPAQGVLAWQTNVADLPIRRLLRQIHHPEVSAATNVERKVLQLLGGGCHLPLGVFCERDAMGHYHAWAAFAPSWNGPVTRVRLSSSTNYQLAEKIAESLIK